MKPLQVTIADPTGLSPARLMDAIEASYYSQSGKRVRANQAQGVHIDGLPAGTIFLEEIA